MKKEEIEKNNILTQKDAIYKAIEYLDMAIDTFPDKDDEIRRHNGALYGIIDILHIMLKDYEIK